METNLQHAVANNLSLVTTTMEDMKSSFKPEITNDVPINPGVWFSESLDDLNQKNLLIYQIMNPIADLASADDLRYEFKPNLALFNQAQVDVNPVPIGYWSEEELVTETMR